VKKFLSGSLVLVIGTIFMSAMNYAYNLFVNRALTAADYATFAAILGALSILSVPVGTVQTVAARYSAEFQAENNISKQRTLYNYLFSRLLVVGLLIFTAFAFFPAHIASIFVENPKASLIIPVILIGLGFIFTLLIPVNRGFMQGRQQFFGLSVNFVGDSFFRVVLGLAFLIPLTNLAFGDAIKQVMTQSLKIQHDWAVAGAVGAVVAGTFLAYLISFGPVADVLKAKAKKVRIDFTEVNKYIWPTLLMYIFLSLLFNIDIILVNRYAVPGTSLTPANAGEYATLSTLAKLVFYITGPIVTVMFPMIADRIKKGVKHYTLLVATLVTVLLTSVVMLGIFAAAPAAVVGLLTPDYVGVAQFLVPMTVIFLVYGLINVMTNYFLSLKDYAFLIPLGVMSVVEIILISLFHSTVVQVIQMVIISQTVLLLLLILIYGMMKKDQLISFFKYSNGK